MVPFSAIRAQLAAAGIAGVTRVSGAAQLAVSLDRAQFDSEMYVSLLEKRADGNSLVNRVRQKVTAKIAVVSIVRDAGSSTGEAQGDAVEARSNAVQAALLGWTPDAPTFAPFTYAGGKLIEFDGAALIWSDEFETDYLIGST